jgi:hypothetical protein
VIAAVYHDEAVHPSFAAELRPLEFHAEAVRAYGADGIMQLSAGQAFLEAQFMLSARVPEWFGFFICHR